MYTIEAICQSPLATKKKATHMAEPSAVSTPSRRTRARPLSAIAPRSGAMNATTKLAIPLAIPSLKVLSVAATPTFQYCLKNSGKKPAMTVTAKAELAQSYIAQPKTDLRVRTLTLRTRESRGRRCPASVPRSAPG